MNQFKFQRYLTHKLISLIAICLFAICSVFFVSKVQSASFDTALIRPATHSIGSSPLPLLVSVKTSSFASEDALTVTVPSEYQFSSTAGAYTVSTTSLPNGFQVWPGVGTASNVSSNTITFPSGDLTPGVTYGFYITGGITSNPSALSAAESVWQIRTVESGGEVDTSYVTVPVESSSSVTITGVIPPSSTDFSVSIASSSSEILNQDEVISFEITYSTEYPTNTSLTLQASWEQGKVGDSTIPTIDVVNYVSGSATNGYGSTAPVINPSNRTITWSIPAISAAAGEQTVSFDLITTNNYQGPSEVHFDVSAVVTDPVASLTSTVTQTYKYEALSSGGSSGSDSDSSDSDDSSSSSSTESTTSTTAVAPSQSSPTITIPTITNSSVAVNVQLSTPQAVELRYGTSANALNQVITSPLFATQHTLSLENLNSDTVYYFRFTTISEKGVRQTSELFTFQTASEPPVLAEDILVNFAFQGIPLVSNSQPNAFPLMILPENQPYELTAVFPENIVVKTLRASIFSESAEQVGAAYQLPFVKVNSNTYLLTFTSLAPYGRYNISFDIEDYAGNKQSMYVGSFMVVKPITIYDAETNEPLEHVELSVERFNQQLQLFEKQNLIEYGPVSEWQSNTQGVINAAFPNGRYRFSFSTPAYESVVVDFEINDLTSEYPQVYMKRSSDFIFSQFGQYFNSLSIVISQSSPFLGTFLSSRNIYTLTSIASLLLLTVGLMYSLSAKIHVSVYRLPSYFLERIQYVNRRNKMDGIHILGKVVDSSGDPVSRAEITLVDKQRNVIDQLVTSANGYFHTILNVKPTQVLVTKEGNVPGEFDIAYDVANKALLLRLESSSKISKAEKVVFSNLRFITSSLFEFLLIILCIAQFYFAQHLGFWIVLPFIIISSLNVIIWTLYLSTHIASHQLTEIEAKK